MTVTREHHALFSGESWMSRCDDCGELVSKYDFTREDAEGALAAHVAERHAQGSLLDQYPAMHTETVIHRGGLV